MSLSPKMQAHLDELRKYHTGRKRTPEQCVRIAKSHTGDKHGLWKGDDVGYWGLHKWVARQLGKPSECENCETTKAKVFEWANLSGQYLRDVSDWARLCRSCHHYIDGIGWQGQKAMREKYFV